MDRSGWTWEFLRRNQDYCKCFQQYQHLGPICEQHSSGAKLYHLSKPCLQAQIWGLQFLVNPELKALNTDIFWQDENLKNKLFMKASEDLEGDFDISQMKCHKTILIERKRELIQLKHSAHNITLISQGSSVRDGRLKVSFECHGLSSVKNMATNLNFLHQVISQTSNNKTTRWTNSTQRLRDCLIALDASLNGSSYRDIASLLYGEDRTDEAWKSPSRFLKDRVRRLVKRGYELMNYDYLSLLS